MPRWSISTWSLHASLGQPFHAFATPGSDELVNRSPQEGRVSLLEVPGECAAHGIGTLELCHFHVPSIARSYIDEFRAALRSAGVELYSVLIDSGNITEPDESKRAGELALIRRWIDLAARLGASRVRIDAGLQEPTPEVVQRSAAHLRELADYAESVGVRVITENWHATSKRPGPLLEILDRCEGRVGLCCDFGNAEGDDKYGTIEKLAPCATSIHAKARYTPDERIDEEDLARCCAIVRTTGFDGPISLIRGAGLSDWDNLMRLRDTMSRHLPNVAVAGAAAR